MRPNLTIAFTALLLLGAPAAQAVEYGFGTAVGSSDYDFTPNAETQRIALCYIDEDGNGVVSPPEPIVLATKLTTNSVCPASLQTISILLTNVPGRAAGQELSLADTWAGKPLKTLTGGHLVRYLEEGSDTSKLDSKDSAYLDIKNTAGSVVDVGDLRLSPWGSFKGGTYVLAGDGDVGVPLTNIRAVARQIHDANVVFKAGSGFYLNSDVGTIGGSAAVTCAAIPCTVTAPVTGDVGVESGDIRLNPKAVNPLTDAALVLPDHVELVQASVAPGQLFQVKVTMKNTGKMAGAGLVETTIDDVVLDGRGTPTIDPNGVAILTITLTAPATPGRHIVKVGTYADFLEVTGASASDSTSRLSEVEGRLETLEAGRGESIAKQGSPGVAPLAAFGVLAAVALLLRRRAA